MQKIRMVSVGKMKEKYWLAAQAEYQKRLGRYASLEIVELKDEPTPENPTPREREAVLKKEAGRVAKAMEGFDAAAVMAIEGRELTSEGFAQALKPYVDGGKSICFVIGGSLGLAREIKERGELFSLSRMTFPHRLARVVLLEQIYRAFKILNNENYHK